MDTKEFDERNMAKSRAVCEMIEREDVGTRVVLTERERRILEMWPCFEDGAPLMYEDEFRLGGEAHTAYGFNFGVGGRVSIGVEHGSHVRLPNGEHVKRPVQSVLDADGVEIEVGDTVYEPNGQSGIVTAVHPSTRCVDLRQDGCDAYAMDTKCLTHTRPDSWARLEEDVGKDTCAYFGFNGKHCDGCPAEGVFVDCNYFKMRDIISRAKALAGVGDA